MLQSAQRMTCCFGMFHHIIVKPGSLARLNRYLLAKERHFKQDGRKIIDSSILLADNNVSRLVGAYWYLIQKTKQLFWKCQISPNRSFFGKILSELIFCPKVVSFYINSTWFKRSVFRVLVPGPWTLASQVSMLSIPLCQHAVMITVQNHTRQHNVNPNSQ